MPNFTESGEIPRVSYDVGKFRTPATIFKNTGKNNYVKVHDANFHVVSVRQEVVMTGIGQVQNKNMFLFRGYDPRDGSIDIANVVSFINAESEEIWCKIYAPFSQSEKGQFISFYAEKINKPSIKQPVITHLDIRKATIEDLTDTQINLITTVPMQFNPSATFDVEVNGKRVIISSMDSPDTTSININLSKSILETDKVTIAYVPTTDKILSIDGQHVELTSLVVNVHNKVKAPILIPPHMLHARVDKSDPHTVIMTYNEDLKGTATNEAFTIHGGTNNGLHLDKPMLLNGKELSLHFANEFLNDNNGNVSIQIVDNAGNFTLEGTQKPVENQTYNVDLTGIFGKPVTFTIAPPLVTGRETLVITPSHVRYLEGLTGAKTVQGHLKAGGKVVPVDINLDVRGILNLCFRISIDASSFKPKAGVKYEVSFVTNPFKQPIVITYLPIVNNIPAPVSFFKETFDVDNLAKYKLTPEKTGPQGNWIVAGGKATFHVIGTISYATIKFPIKAGLGDHFKVVIETEVGAVLQDIYFKEDKNRIDCPDIAVNPASNWKDVNVYYGSGTKLIHNGAITDPSTTGIIECEINNRTHKCILNGYAFDLPNPKMAKVPEPTSMKIGLKNDAVFKTITLIKL